MRLFLLSLALIPSLSFAATFADLEGKTFSPLEGGCVVHVENHADRHQVHLVADHGVAGPGYSGCAGIGESWIFGNCSESECKAFFVPWDYGSRERVILASLKITEQGFNTSYAELHGPSTFVAGDRASHDPAEAELIEAARKAELEAYEKARLAREQHIQDLFDKAKN